MKSKREKLSLIVRLLVAFGILALTIVFLRACFSPTPLPAARAPLSPDAPPASSGLMPSRY